MLHRVWLLAAVAAVVAAAPSDTQGTMLSNVARATAQLVAKGAEDLELTGGATVMSEGFDTCLRSGSPHQAPIAALVAPLAPGTTVQSLSFTFEYTAGFSGADGSNFSVVIGDTALYESGVLGNYTYKKAPPGDYSPPIRAQVTGLGVAVPKSGVSRIELRFQNNGRNLQLRLPLRFNPRAVRDWDLVSKR